MAENRGPELLGINITFCIITCSIVLLRCYTRAFIVKAFGVDDWIIILATMCYLGYITASNMGVKYGTGQHKDALTEADYQRAMMQWWFCYLFFSLTMVASKVSFAWFLLRIVNKQTHAWLIYAATMCTVLGGLVFFFVTLLQCQPISHYWDKTGAGHCISMDVVIALAYLYSAFSVITDFTFAILLGFVVWHLNLQKRARIVVIFLITMGCVASAAVIVRVPFLKFLKEPDFLWDTTDIAIWSTIEMSLAISAVSISTLRPLIRAVGWSLGISSKGTGDSHQHGTSGRRSTPKSHLSSKLGHHVYIKSEFSQDASCTDRDPKWIVGTRATAFAAHSDSEGRNNRFGGGESLEYLEMTNSDRGAEEGHARKASPKYFLP
ncbi:integral membrane protein, putative [Cordyceps militaris CM01]|uniref:Integral membrane protein, putative n=1 Tax=Cordyceps militaris (strain CM01) TaxID=983644 RepID=G3JCL8_CORMM|nr:integral membrane protein, putative [Cordyceps militaris CM01]EGX93830.1 integral membrane protein, putative [Cordyceps militaris CM01]